MHQSFSCETTASDSLLAGLRAVRHRPIPLLVGWIAAVSAAFLIACFAPVDFSTQLQLGATLAWPAILLAHLSLHVPHNTQSSRSGRARRTLMTAMAAVVSIVVVIAMFRLIAWVLWFVVSLLGSLLYAFVTFEEGVLLDAEGLLRLLATIPFAVASFVFVSRLILAPAIAVRDGVGPIQALRRSWDMTLEHARPIRGVIVTCMVIPTASALSGFALGGRTTTALPPSTWPEALLVAGLLCMALFFGPWMTASIAHIHSCLRREQAFFDKRLQARRTSFSQARRSTASRSSRKAP